MKRAHLLALLTAGHAFEHWYHGLLGPVMPFLAQDLGFTFTQIGLLFTGRAILSAFSSAGTGFLIDAIGGGKWLLVGGLAGIALVHGGVSLLESFWLLAPVFWLSGMATHSWHPPAMGLLGDRFRDRKGLALGVHGTGANVGQTLAPLVAGYLLLTMSWRGVMQVNMIPLLGVALLLWAFLPSFELGAEGTRPKALRPHDILRSLLQNHAMIGASIFSGVRTLAHNTIGIFLPFLLVQKYGASSSTVGVALGIYAAASILPETAVGYLSDRIPRKAVLFIGLCAGGLALIAIPGAGGGLLLLVPLSGVGIFLISLRSVLFAYGFETTPPHLAGSVVGVMFTSNQIFVGAGLLAAGMISDAYGPGHAFWFAGGLCFLFLPLFLWMPRPDANAARAELSAAQSESAPQAP